VGSAVLHRTREQKARVRDQAAEFARQMDELRHQDPDATRAEQEAFHRRLRARFTPEPVSSELMSSLGYTVTSSVQEE